MLNKSMPPDGTGGEDPTTMPGGAPVADDQPTAGDGKDPTTMPGGGPVTGRY